MPEEAKERGINTVQIFVGNPRGWYQKDPEESDIRVFKEKMKEYDISPLVVHMPYLPNPASPDKDKYKKSCDSLVDQFRKSAMIGAEYLNIHIGKAMGSTYEQALERIVKAVQGTFQKVEPGVMLLLENTAGQGTEIGTRFEHIRDIIDRVAEKDRLGVCLDTAHLFEAGYDLRDEKSVKATFKEFDKMVGLKYLKVIHYNDSMTDYESHVDRHWHIGKGKIGAKGMRAIINHKPLKNSPFIMETPVKEPGDEKRNLNTLKSYLG